MVNIQELPPEIIHKVFFYLDYSDLKSVILSCTFWSMIGKNPTFWKDIKLAEIHPLDLRLVNKIFAILFSLHIIFH